MTVRTLVLRRPGNPPGSPSPPDPVASEIARAQRVDLPGNDFHWLGEDIDSLLAEVSRFVTGESHVPEPQRELCAVVFTDLVGSTEHAAALGDLRWKGVLERHDTEVARIVERTGGRMVKTTGDGVLATFRSADRALQAAHRIRASLREDELAVRVGVHVGDVERRPDDVSGLAVHIAARVMALAEPGEVLATASVAIAAAGTDHEFEPIGERSLKGVSGTWMVFRTTA
jgi:class 3 adenylate cyclase